MIVTRKVCKCAVCEWEWLPKKSKANPTAEARKVKRCASCKSCSWNNDDPKIAEVKSARPEPQYPDGGKTVTLIDAQTRQHLVTGQVCRHRIFLAACPLCNPSLKN